MWRLKSKAVTVEPIDAPPPVAVSPEALTAATVGPAPLTDAAVIAQLRRQLEARGETVLRLQAELRDRPRVVDGCPGCAGLRKTIADLEAARREDRAAIARLQLADPGERGRTWTAPRAEVP